MRRTTAAAETPGAKTTSRRATGATSRWRTTRTSEGTVGACVFNLGSDVERFAHPHVHTELAGTGSVVIWNARSVRCRVEIESAIARLHHVGACGCCDCRAVIELV